MRYLLCLTILTPTLTGCTHQPDPPATTAASPPQPTEVIAINDTTALAAKYKVKPPAPSPASKQSPPTPNAPACLDLASLWVPSGWMGDAPAGAVEHRVCRDNPHTAPTCEEWKYDPAKGSQGWAAVSYQWPENNFGDHPGRDLKRAYTHLLFAARADRPGTQVQFKSGGHTRPGARHPASYETTLGVVTLDTQWRTFTIPIGPDDSNVASIFTFVFTSSQTPEGCKMWIDSLELIRE